jgi:hypothetical protein
VCWPAAACAQTSLLADRDTPAKLFLAWNDQAILRLNEEPPRDLGRQAAFRQRALNIQLKRGDNRLVLKIDNTKGTTWGAWCFNCRVVLPDGRVLVPTVV